MPSSNTILIFANPVAGRGKGLAIAKRLDARFKGDGLDSRLVLERPRDLVSADLPPDVQAAVVVGGDGTLREVADRLCALCVPGECGSAGANSTPSDPPPLLVVPLGTANLMGRNLGVNWDDEKLEGQVTRTIAEGKIVSRDVGRVNGELFLLMVGVGFDAAVVHELNKVRKGPITMLNYVVPAAFAMAQYQYPPLVVTVDGRKVFGPSPAVVMVGNLPEYGTGFPVLPNAKGDDGLLHVCVLPARTPFDLARFLLLTTTGDHLLVEGVVYTTGKQVTVAATQEQVPVQIDGDAAGHTPVTADLMPVRLRFIVP